MNFNWAAYLDLAKELAQHTDDQSKLRTAVSRAYYALYNSVARDFKARGEQGGMGEGSHQKVWIFYSGLRLRGAQKLSTQGERLRKFRVDADYYVDEIKPATVESAILLAEKGMNLLGQLPENE